MHVPPLILPGYSHRERKTQKCRIVGHAASARCASPQRGHAFNNATKLPPQLNTHLRNYNADIVRYDVGNVGPVGDNVTLLNGAESLSSASFISLRATSQIEMHDLKITGEAVDLSVNFMGVEKRGICQAGECGPFFNTLISWRPNFFSLAARTYPDIN